MIPEAVFLTEGLARNWQRCRRETVDAGVLVDIYDVPVLTYESPLVGYKDDPTIQEVADEYTVLYGVAELAGKDAELCLLVGTEARGKLKWHTDKLINEFDQDNKPRAYRVNQDRLLIVKRDDNEKPDITIIDIIPADTQ